MGPLLAWVSGCMAPPPAGRPLGPTGDARGKGKGHGKGRSGSAVLADADDRDQGKGRKKGEGAAADGKGKGKQQGGNKRVLRSSTVAAEQPAGADGAGPSGAGSGQARPALGPEPQPVPCRALVLRGLGAPNEGWTRYPVLLDDDALQVVLVKVLPCHAIGLTAWCDAGQAGPVARARTQSWFPVLATPPQLP